MPTLDGVSVDLARGSFTAVMGSSGSGKSTFLHCAAGLDQTTSGEVWLGDEELSGAREARLTVIRRAHPRQVRRMMRVETAVVVLTAVAVGLLSALPPLVGVSLRLTESPIPSVSPTALAGIVGVAALLGWFSIMVPTGVVMRARPVDAIGVRE